MRTALIFIGIVLIATLIGTWVFQLVWNAALPIVWAAAPKITFWQAFLVSLLIHMIGSAFKTTVANK